MTGVAKLKDLEKQAAAESTKGKYLGVEIICGANRERYGKLL